VNAFYRRIEFWYMKIYIYIYTYGNSVDVLRYCIVHSRFEDRSAATREIK
jgi:hypothetical protein